MRRPFENIRIVGPLFSSSSEYDIEIKEGDAFVPEQGISSKLIGEGVLPPERLRSVDLVLKESGEQIAKASYSYSSDTAVIRNVEVRSDKRGIGVGTEIKQAMLEDMESRGIDKVYTVAVTKGGKALAKSTGFTQDAPLFEDDESVMFKMI